MNGVINIFPYAVLSDTQKDWKIKTIKDVTNHKKNETITPLFGDETNVLYSNHLQ